MSIGLSVQQPACCRIQVAIDWQRSRMFGIVPAQPLQVAAGIEECVVQEANGVAEQVAGDWDAWNWFASIPVPLQLQTWNAQHVPSTPLQPLQGAILCLWNGSTLEWVQPAILEALSPAFPCFELRLHQ